MFQKQFCSKGSFRPANTILATVWTIFAKNVERFRPNYDTEQITKCIQKNLFFFKTSSRHADCKFPKPAGKNSSTGQSFTKLPRSTRKPLFFHRKCSNCSSLHEEYSCDRFGGKFSSKTRKSYCSETGKHFGKTRNFQKNLFAAESA